MLHKLLACIQSHECTITAYKENRDMCDDAECIRLHYPALSINKELHFQISLHNEVFIFAITEELLRSNWINNRIPVTVLKSNNPKTTNPLIEAKYVHIQMFCSIDMDWYTLTKKYLAKWSMENGY